MECIKTQQRINRSQWLLNQPVTEVMLKLTLPMLPAIMAILGLDLFDAFLVGQLGTESLAALSFTIPVTSILFALAIGLSIGTSSVLSFSLGKGDHHKARKLVTDSLIMASILALIIGVIGVLTIEPLFAFLGANYALIPESFHLGPRPDIMPIISDYMQLRYLGFVFMLLPILSNSIMRATGDTPFAGKLMLCWALVTALLDSLLMLSNPTSSSLSDIGLGHLIADITFSIFSIITLYKREKLLELKKPEIKRFMSNCHCVLRIGLPAMGMSLFTPIALALVTNWVAFYGREAIAVFGVMTRLESLALFLPMALSTSLPTFVGQNFGGGLIERVKEGIKKSLALTMIVQIIIYLLLVMLAGPLAELFATSPQVSHMITQLLYFLPLSYAGQGIVILVTSACNAIHHPKSALLLSSIRMFVLFVPAAYIGAYFNGLDGIYIGLMLANLLIGIIAFSWVNYFFKSSRPANFSGLKTY